MYRIVKIEDTIRVPPSHFNSPLKESSLNVLRNMYEGRIDKDIGLVIMINKVNSIGPGVIIPGDGATYHKVEFEALVYKPILHEVTLGKVGEITQFGAFVKIGPIDGLVHVSQVADDYISYNEKMGVLTGKETKKTLKVGDVVRARIVSVSLKPVITESKIGLTMRQPGLGKLEWIEEEKRGKKRVRKKRDKGEEKGKKKGGKK